MAQAGFGRSVIVAALVVAQTLGLSLAVASQAYAELCHAHAVLESRDDLPAASAHGDHFTQGAQAGHRADRPPVLQGESETAFPGHGFGCCMSHMLGLAVLAEPVLPTMRMSSPALMSAPALTPGELAAHDPPPRFLF